MFRRELNTNDGMIPALLIPMNVIGFQFLCWNHLDLDVMWGQFLSESKFHLENFNYYNLLISGFKVRLIDSITTEMAILI